MAGVDGDLFLSTTGNVFNAAADTPEGSTTTDASGKYSFSGLSAGTYFVRQEAPAGYQQHAGGDISEVTITPTQAAGSGGLVIDAFNQTPQAAEASLFLNAPLVTSVVPAPEAIGGFRDLTAQATSATGNVSLTVDQNSPDELDYETGRTPPATASSPGMA